MALNLRFCHVELFFGFRNLHYAHAKKEKMPL